MKTDLEFLQSLNERELSELVLIPLLASLNYRDIRYTHGISEYGKDIVCSRLDPIDGHTYVGFVVKSIPLEGSVSSSRSIRETLFQVEQALTVPFINPFDGKEVRLSKAYVLTPHSISQTCIRSIAENLRERAPSTSFIDGPKLLDLLVAHLPTLLSTLPDLKQRYINSLFQRLLQIRTFASYGTYREYRIPEIYTGGMLSKTTPEEAQYISFAKGRTADGKSIHDIFPSNPFMVVLADVGAGKTTLLQKFAIDNISLPSGILNPQPKLTPILVKLSAIPSGKLHFVNWLKDHLTNNFGDSAILDSSSNLLLLDGFDEIPSKHSYLIHQIQELATTRIGGIIITSRPSRIPRLISPFNYFKLNPFSDAEILQFLLKWYPDSQNNANKLFDRIRDDETLLGFCRTPLFLTLYAALATTRKIDSLPTRRTDIYDSVTRLLLGEWDEMRSVPGQFSSSAKEYCLELLAYETHTKSMKSFSEDQLLRTIAQVLRSEAEYKGLKSSAFFDELLFRSRLIRLNESLEYEFAHLSFQEFFAAKHLVRKADKREIQELLFEDWWKDTLVFYFGLVRTMDDVRITHKESQSNGHVLMEYLAEADYSSKSTRDSVLSVVAKEILLTKDLPSSVLDVCKKFHDDLLPILQSIVSSYTSTGSNISIYSFNYFRFLLKLGRMGGYAAVESLPLLDHLAPDAVFNVLQETLNQIGDSNWQNFFRKSLPILERGIISHYRTLQFHTGESRKIRRVFALGTLSSLDGLANELQHRRDVHPKDAREISALIREIQNNLTRTAPA